MIAYQHPTATKNNPACNLWSNLTVRWNSIHFWTRSIFPQLELGSSLYCSFLFKTTYWLPYPVSQPSFSLTCDLSLACISLAHVWPNICKAFLYLQLGFIPHIKWRYTSLGSRLLCLFIVLFGVYPVKPYITKACEIHCRMGCFRERGLQVVCGKTWRAGRGRGGDWKSVSQPLAALPTPLSEPDVVVAVQILTLL